MANQGSILHWSRDHRVHHKYSETPFDPHDANRGFFYAHVGWLLLKKSEKVKEAGRKLDLSDLYEDKVVMFQDKLDPWINLFMCFVVPTLIGKYFCNQSAYLSLIFLGFFRYLFVLHSTWFVNSLAHWVGYRPYDPSINPSENGMVSLFALGEGWHNWHHLYPWDYATSEYGIWKRWNPTKLQIDVFAALGLVWDRKRAVETWNAAKKRISKQQDEMGSYLQTAKTILLNQQSEIGNILENAKKCFDTQQNELGSIFDDAKKNLEIDTLLDNAKKSVECQQAEFTALVEAAKTLFETQQKELANVLDGLPQIHTH